MPDLATGLVPDLVSAPGRQMHVSDPAPGGWPPETVAQLRGLSAAQPPEGVPWPPREAPPGVLWGYGPPQVALQGHAQLRNPPAVQEGSPL